MQPYVIFEHLCHQTVDTAPDVRKQHEDVRTIVSRGQRSLDRVDLTTNSFNTSN